MYGQLLVTTGGSRLAANVAGDKVGMTDDSGDVMIDDWWLSTDVTIDRSGLAVDVTGDKAEMIDISGDVTGDDW